MHALPISRVPTIAWIIPAIIVLTGLVTINSWLPDPLADYHAEQVRMMDNEDEAVCVKLVSTAEQLSLCKAEIRMLRQRDRDSGPFY